jgi:hypothetical protein
MTARLHHRPITFAFAAVLAAGALANTVAAAPTAPATPQPMAPLYACIDLKEDAARLACFDKQVATLRGAEQAGSFRAIDRASVEQIEKESFGFNLPSLPRLALPKLGASQVAAGPTEQTYTVERISGGEKPAYIMTDGTVWRQIEVDSNRNIRKGATVVVEKAMLGSFLMSPTKGGGRGLRVRREQ